MDHTLQIQSILTLGVLCAILYGAYYMTKKVRKQRFSGDIRIVDRLPVENNVSLAIAKIRDQEYIISISPKGVRLLKTLESSRANKSE